MNVQVTWFENVKKSLRTSDLTTYETIADMYAAWYPGRGEPTKVRAYDAQMNLLHSWESVPNARISIDVRYIEFGDERTKFSQPDIDTKTDAVKSSEPSVLRKDLFLLGYAFLAGVGIGAFIVMLAIGLLGIGR